MAFFYDSGILYDSGRQYCDDALEFFNFEAPLHDPFIGEKLHHIQLIVQHTTGSRLDINTLRVLGSRGRLIEHRFTAPVFFRGLKRCQVKLSHTDGSAFRIDQIRAFGNSKQRRPPN